MLLSMLDYGDCVIVIKHDEFLAHLHDYETIVYLFIGSMRINIYKVFVRIEAYYVVLFININNFFILTPVVFLECF